jgi:phosphoribosylglycinamide formyltransferase 1
LIDITVLASGHGTNYSAIIQNGIPVSHVVTNNPDAGIIAKAHNDGTYWSIIEQGNDSRDQWGSYLISIIGNPDLIVCAGFMKILPHNVCEEYRGKIINLHPSLLPAYKGSVRAIEDAYNDGSTVYGATVHYVTENVDDGEIIAQESITVDSECTLEHVEELVHRVEHSLLPKTIREILAL